MAARGGIGLAKSLQKQVIPQRTVQTSCRYHSIVISTPKTCRGTKARLLPITYINSNGCSNTRYSSSSAAPKKTQLYDFHVSHGGKMVEFGGFSMPVTYSDLSIVESSIWTREKASLFDVSHMLQHKLIGEGATDFLARITPSDPHSLPPMHGSLSAILHPTGGIVDDCIITNLGVTEREKQPTFYFVTNAGNRDKDTAYIFKELEAFKKEHPEKGEKLQWTMLKDDGLIALQGPLSAEILKGAGASTANGEPIIFDNFHFGQCTYMKFKDMATACLVSRGGYTGEDGFEISIPSAGRLGENKTLKLTQLLLDTAGSDKLRLAGLGARDTLRLEAGMCLYGHDIDDNTTPVEAGLSWIIPKSRRSAGGFLGADTIIPQILPKKDGGVGVTRRRVGFEILDKAPAREGAKIVDETGKEIGVLTSGSPSPTLKKNIAMGYVKNGMHKAGTEVGVVVRGKTRKAVVSKMPFVPSKYYKGPALLPA